MRLPCIALHAKIKMNLDTFLSLELLLGNIRNQGTAFVILFGELMLGLRIGGFKTSEKMREHKLILSAHCMYFLS